MIISRILRNTGRKQTKKIDDFSKSTQKANYNGSISSISKILKTKRIDKLPKSARISLNYNGSSKPRKKLCKPRRHLFNPKG